MANIVKPSLSFLPMEDIAAELRSEKANRRFMTREDKASDVVNVAGKDATTIAVAVSPTNRTTIDNALNLNGIPASEYLSKDEGNKILGVSTTMSTLFSEEVKDLRDELYQLENQLSKKGFVEDKVAYKGFHDSFKKSNIKYEGFICGIANAIIGNTEELAIGDLTKARFFEKNKKFIIRRDDLEKEVVVTSLGISSSGKVKFMPTVNFLDSTDAVSLYKTTGEYVRDSFSFSEIKRDVANPLKERYHMQSDDTRTAYQTINKSNSGYAAYFKIPNSAAGALTKFGIRAKVEGTPGSLICHMLKKDAIYNSQGNFRVDFKNIEDAKEKGYWLATSQPVQSSQAATEQEVYFNFFDIASNKYPTVEGTQYLFIVECLAATEQDFWKVRFSYFQNGNDEHDDLQRYNNSFIYDKVLSTGLESDDDPIKVIDNIDKYDLLFTAVTRELIKEDEMGKQEGVYTANILLPNPIDVSRARLITRINREGCYFIEAHNNDYTIFTIKGENSTSHAAGNNRFREGDTIVIGNQTATINRVTGDQIEVKNPVRIDQRIFKFYSRTVFNPDTAKYETITRVPVYRMNYTVSIKPSLIDWDVWEGPTTGFQTTDLVEDPLNMPFSKILPDGSKTNKRVSDRLMFEADFGRNEDDIANVANYFELQIHWKSPFSYDEINDFKDQGDDNFKELIGRLHDIVLTFDKNY